MFQSVVWSRGSLGPAKQLPEEALKDFMQLCKLAPNDKDARDKLHLAGKAFGVVLVFDAARGFTASAFFSKRNMFLVSLIVFFEWFLMVS